MQWAHALTTAVIGPRHLLAGGLWLALTACTPAWQPPLPADEIALETASQTVSRGGATVTVAVPSAMDTKQLFGTDLYKSRVQPVWIKIENETCLLYTSPSPRDS